MATLCPFRPLEVLPKSPESRHPFRWRSGTVEFSRQLQSHRRRSWSAKRQASTGPNGTGPVAAEKPAQRPGRQSLAQAEQRMLGASPVEAAGALAQVTNARQNWRRSVVSRNDALTDYYTNYFRLQRSLGTEAVR